jgi:hypothetical protein
VAYAGQKSAQDQAIADAQVKEAQAQLGIQQNYADYNKSASIDQAKAAQDAHDKDVINSNQLRDELAQKYTVDPNRYWNGLSAPERVQSMVSRFLGGFAALAGQANPGLQFFEHQIDRDIDAQKTDATNHFKKTAELQNLNVNEHNMNQHWLEYKDKSRLAYLQGLQMELDKVHQESLSPIIRAKAAQGAIDINSRINQLQAAHGVQMAQAAAATVAQQNALHDKYRAEFQAAIKDSTDPQKAVADLNLAWKGRGLRSGAMVDASQIQSPGKAEPTIQVEREKGAQAENKDYATKSSAIASAKATLDSGNDLTKEERDELSKVGVNLPETGWGPFSAARKDAAKILDTAQATLDKEHKAASPAAPVNIPGLVWK